MEVISIINGGYLLYLIIYQEEIVSTKGLQIVTRLEKIKMSRGFRTTVYLYLLTCYILSEFFKVPLSPPLNVVCRLLDYLDNLRYVHLSAKGEKLGKKGVS